MNVLNILSEIEKIDPEVYGRLDTRRKAMRQFGNIGRKLAAAAVPLAFGSMLNKAYGQAAPTAVADILNFALTLEYLEAEFYTTALGKAGLIPEGAGKTAIQTISAHETAHVKFLQTAITGAGATPVAKPTFDFTYGAGSGTGPLATAFNDYATFLIVAQALEDTGVRAYKGQAPALVGKGDVLTAALNIHSVEARHASHIRQMRRAMGATTLKPWITGNDPGAGAANALITANYAGEDNTTQGGKVITTLPGVSGNVSTNAATESFDEPLTYAQVIAIVTPFIKK